MYAGNVTYNMKERNRRVAMKWTTPEYSDLRFGFEITMYILNR
jgi:pyrroloquinoline quinone biosynthesis protein A